MPGPDDIDEREGRYRNGSPDALFGSVLAMEAVLKRLLEVLAPGGNREALDLLRRRVEADLAQRQRTTKYGTGAEEIDEGAADTLDALFGPRAPR